MAISKIINEHYDPTSSVQVPNYVSGRLLTPEDLKKDREAALQRLAHVGRGAGTGIVEGLWVEKSGDSGLTVNKGMGINRAGHPIVMTSDLLSISLPPASSGVVQQSKTIFGPCEPQLSANAGDMLNGPYLLTALPVSRLTNPYLTVQKILPGNKTKEVCENCWEEEGIVFRIIYLGQPDLPMGFLTTTPANQQRNLLAHWCYGTERLLTRIRDPFNGAPDLDYTGFDQARPALTTNKDLTDCDLHLAVFYWENKRVTFVDNWAVRRRLHGRSLLHPTATNAAGQGRLYPGWGMHVSDQLAAEGEARFLQFQEQLDTLRISPNAATLRADTYFRYLPPAGYVPLATSESLRQMVGQFVVNLFLDEVKKYTPNPTGFQPPWDTNPILTLTVQNSDNHVEEHQMNALIVQFNGALEAIIDSANALALALSQLSIQFDPITPLRPHNAGELLGFWEVDSNGHVIDATFNIRIQDSINNRLTQVTTLINQLGANYNVNINPILIGEVLSAPGFNRPHINVANLNTVCVTPLNQVFSQFVNALNTIGNNTLLAINPVAFFKKIRDALNLLLQPSLSEVFNAATNGVQIEKFFARSETAHRIKTLTFTDHQTLQHMLESSWREPAIDLFTDQKLNLVLVYEDVVPYVAERLKTVIEIAQFDYQDNLRAVWNAGVKNTFAEIIANKNAANRPQLYGLFTHSSQPLQIFTPEIAPATVVLLVQGGPPPGEA